eukprot:TRINITY_DN11670_c0_g1_i1.p1 TRINITY_DN11670_c0_g1~~TRINITY_DN11670_c0_g1_i1.p1  ORF type:complete len:106 (-),score=0.47 TRINITY_DN11670_c0_g1_i1:59-376(-)
MDNFLQSLPSLAQSCTLYVSLGYFCKSVVYPYILTDKYWNSLQSHQQTKWTSQALTFVNAAGVTCYSSYQLFKLYKKTFVDPKNHKIQRRTKKVILNIKNSLLLC